MQSITAYSHFAGVPVKTGNFNVFYVGPTRSTRGSKLSAVEQTG